MISKYIQTLKVLYEDNHLLVVEKFPNVLSQKDETGDISMNEIIKEYIRIKYNKPGNVYLGLIHRLDRRVGGVMVFAKTSKAAARLSEDIRKHKFEKYYIAFCFGEVKNSRYCDNIIKDEKRKISKISENGKEAILECELINKTIYQNVIHSYALIDLKTGRFNQIRCQMAYHKHPLVNDYKYGYKSLAETEEIGLWCYKISFDHPTTKEKLVFETLPKGNIWEKLEWRNSE